MAHVEDYLHGLSQIEFHLQSNRDLPAWSFATQSDRDHVDVLEGLALLLVFAPTEDVAATSYWRTTTELILLWAKNQPVDDVSQNNQRQEESNLWKFDENKEPYQKLEAALRKEGWLTDKSTVQGLDNFTRFVGRVTKASEIIDFWNILYFSWAVTTVADLKEVLEEKQIRYLSKLGDYVRILRYMPEILKKAGNAEIIAEQVFTQSIFLSYPFS